MKKKVLILSLLAICAVIAASGTLAYYTVSERAHSVITTGSVNMEIEEWQDTGSGWTPYPSGQPIPAMPGVTVSKIATVSNNQAESYIRGIGLSEAEIVQLKDRLGRTWPVEKQ